MSSPSPLDDPRTAEFAFARFKRIMRIMGAITAVVVAAILLYLWIALPEVSIHFYIAVALGVGFSMMLTSALMGLVFLSNGTGHDDSVTDPLEDTWRDR
ncbi:hypothetical protein [Tsuneonella amylolytica]|uniref:hypothetical protein n=1 Tax=Tsuneonella amylolytica TaxID=2338327 RepID=UPI000EA97AB8|nr:hypothetical protein [Tsuneonella amylolytica]